MKRILALAAAAVAVALSAASPASPSAWTAPYAYGLSAPAGSQLAYAIVGVKRELAYNGFAGGMVLDAPVFGDAARNATTRFQTSRGLSPDGVVGPTTARYLFRARALAFERTYAIPSHLLARQKTLESANDPNAIGPSGHDLGLYQIFLPYHPDVTIAEAIDPAFSTAWTAVSVSGAHEQLGDWDGAVAAHNVGLYYAGLWVKAGKPTSGYVLSDGTDIFAVASRYVRLVRASLY